MAAVVVSSAAARRAVQVVEERMDRRQQTRKNNIKRSRKDTAHSDAIRVGLHTPHQYSKTQNIHTYIHPSIHLYSRSRLRALWQKSLTAQGLKLCSSLFKSTAVTKEEEEFKKVDDSLLHDLQTPSAFRFMAASWMGVFPRCERRRGKKRERRSCQEALGTTVGRWIDRSIHPSIDPMPYLSSAARDRLRKTTTTAAAAAAAAAATAAVTASLALYHKAPKPIIVNKSVSNPIQCMVNHTHMSLSIYMHSKNIYALRSTNRCTF